MSYVKRSAKVRNFFVSLVVTAYVFLISRIPVRVLEWSMTPKNLLPVIATTKQSGAVQWVGATMRHMLTWNLGSHLLRSFIKPLAHAQMGARWIELTRSDIMNWVMSVGLLQKSRQKTDYPVTIG